MLTASVGGGHAYRLPPGCACWRRATHRRRCPLPSLEAHRLIATPARGSSDPPLVDCTFQNLLKIIEQLEVDVNHFTSFSHNYVTHLTQLTRLFKPCAYLV